MNKALNTRVLMFWRNATLTDAKAKIAQFHGHTNAAIAKIA